MRERHAMTGHTRHVIIDTLRMTSILPVSMTNIHHVIVIDIHQRNIGTLVTNTASVTDNQVIVSVTDES